MKWEPQISQDQCDRCGICVYVCPRQILLIQDDRLRVVDSAACTCCALCEALCHRSAVMLPYWIIRAGAAPDQ